jgi:uncharacterized protein YhjY with autotransporter beta-barrel domain
MGSEGDFAVNAVASEGVIADTDPQSVVVLSHCLWSQYSSTKLTLNHKQNSQLGDTKNSGSSLKAGTLLSVQKNVALGVFVSASNNEITQNYYNRAIVNSFEGGFYGGIFGQNSELKFHLSLGQHNFSTRRNIELVNDYKPLAQFNATSFKGGLQATYVSKSVRNFDIKPFVGFRTALISNEEINEKGGEITNLKVLANDYKSLTGFAGLKLQTDAQNFSWYIKGEIEYLFLGNDTQSQFQMKFLQDQTQPQGVMNIKGLQTDALSLGIAVGIEFPISDSLNLYGDTQYLKSADITFSQTNIGAKIKFHTILRQPKPKVKETITHQQITYPKISNEEIYPPTNETYTIRLLVEKNGKSHWLKPITITIKHSQTLTLPQQIKTKIQSIKRSLILQNYTITHIKISAQSPKSPQTAQQIYDLLK